MWFLQTVKTVKHFFSDYLLYPATRKKPLRPAAQMDGHLCRYQKKKKKKKKKNQLFCSVRCRWSKILVSLFTTFISECMSKEKEKGKIKNLNTANPNNNQNQIFNVSL